MSNFQKVKCFNRAFDMVSKEPSEYIGYIEDINGFIKINPFINSNLKIFDSHSLIRLRLNLIKEEIGELNVAIKNNDYKEIRDAIGDILYVVYGMSDVLCIDIDYIFITNLQKELMKYYLNDSHNSSENINNKFIDNIIISSENGNKKITNFNYIKIFIKKLCKCNHNDSDTIIEANIKLKNHMLKKLNDEYLKLEQEFEIETIYFDNDKKQHSNENKFLIVSQLLYNLLKITYILANLYNINADSDFAIIHESNMSKLCDTEEDAIATVVSYNNKYQNGTSPYDSPYCYELPDLQKWIVKNKSTGKALKNIKYKEVSFDEISFENFF